MNTGAIVGICVAGIVVVTVTVLLIVFRKRIFANCCPKTTINDIKSYKDKSPYEYNYENDEIAQEFNSLQHYRPEIPTKIANKPANLPKNRYPDAVPYDRNIVKISSKKYINASEIFPDFIATQDPLPAEEDVFWSAVWENNVRIIVRLSSDSDLSQIPAGVYLPPRRWVVDDLEVSNNSEPFHRANYIERHLEITPIRDEIRDEFSMRDIVHYQITSWSRGQLPNVKDFLQLMQDIRKMKRFFGDCNSPKILVHCGAGSGRTGTFIAIWMMMEKIDNGLQPAVYDTIKGLRDERPLMVNTFELYYFVYSCVNQYWVFRRQSAVSLPPENIYEAVTI